MNEKEITINVTIRYSYNIDKIKELIKEIIDLEDVKNIGGLN